MKMTLEKMRLMDESKMADADHPFREDISVEEFREIINESAKETIKVKAKSPIVNEAWHVTKEQIIKALNSSKSPC
ncbi:MAG: hypothetical protein ACKOX3_03010 [Bacteroidota bacterium]